MALHTSGISSFSASPNIVLPSSTASNALHREFGFFTGIEDLDLTLAPGYTTAVQDNRNLDGGLSI